MGYIYLLTRHWTNKYIDISKHMKVLTVIWVMSIIIGISKIESSIGKVDCSLIWQREVEAWFWCRSKFEKYCFINSTTSLEFSRDLYDFSFVKIRLFHYLNETCDKRIIYNKICGWKCYHFHPPKCSKQNQPTKFI